MSRIEQGGAKALETRLVAKGLLVGEAGARRFELQGGAAGQVCLLEGDTGDRVGPATIEADLLDAAEGRLRVVSIRPVQ